VGWGEKVGGCENIQTTRMKTLKRGRPILARLFTDSLVRADNWGAGKRQKNFRSALSAAGRGGGERLRREAKGVNRLGSFRHARKKNKTAGEGKTKKRSILRQLAEIFERRDAVGWKESLGGVSCDTAKMRD